MPSRQYLQTIRHEVGQDQYSAWEARANAAYEAMTRQAMHGRQRGQNHDPHKARSHTVGGLILAMYSLHIAGADAIIELKPRERNGTSNASTDLGIQV